MAVFDSTGYTDTGTPYDRPGRATVVLGRDAVGQEWIAQHASPEAIAAAWKSVISAA